MHPYNQSYEEQPSYTVPSPVSSNLPAPYAGNQKDVLAFAAMIVGTMLIASCIPGIGCLMPIFALVGGIIGVRGADQAVDPSRTRTYSWIAIISGTLLLLLFLAIVLLYGALIVAIMQAAANQEF